MSLENRNGYTIACYIRLSSEDNRTETGGVKAESDSVINQRGLLYDYICGREEFTSCKIIEKIDDGYSGVNFERPSFCELMELCYQRKINCIIVKDFSRLGRNYIEVGNYLEQVFPLLGIRFISVNDEYDSGHQMEGGIEVGLKNLIYEWYSWELSQKVRDVIGVKQKRGEYLSGYPLYGFQRSKVKVNHLEIEEETAKVVRDIFAMKRTGMTLKYIANELNRRKIPTPAEYANIKYGRKQPLCKASKDAWKESKISRILHEERYTGRMISHQHQVQGVRGGIRRVPSKQWIRVDNQHEAIVSQEEFDIVNQFTHSWNKTGSAEHDI